MRGEDRRGGGSLALPRTSAPAARALESAGIHDLADVARHTRREVAALHGMGPKALGALADSLAAAGLAFRPDNPRG